MLVLRALPGGEQRLLAAIPERNRFGDGQRFDDANGMGFEQAGDLAAEGTKGRLLDLNEVAFDDRVNPVTMQADLTPVGLGGVPLLELAVEGRFHGERSGGKALGECGGNVVRGEGTGIEEDAVEGPDAGGLFHHQGTKAPRKRNDLMSQ